MFCTFIHVNHALFLYIYLFQKIYPIFIALFRIHDLSISFTRSFLYFNFSSEKVGTKKKNAFLEASFIFVSMTSSYWQCSPDMIICRLTGFAVSVLSLHCPQILRVTKTPCPPTDFAHSLGWQLGILPLIDCYMLTKCLLIEKSLKSTQTFWFWKGK